MRITFCAADDREFLHAVYASTRTEELAQVPWPPEQKAAFLRSQFEAQDAHYKTYYSNASFQIVEVDGERAGRLYVSRGSEEIRIVDIALLPEFRGKGVGGRLLAPLIEEARARQVPLRIHVEIFNPAKLWYERLGFRELEHKGVYVFMELR